VTVRQVYGDAAAVLAAACAGADLLLVGSRGRGPLEGWEPASTHGRVIVGVDASEHSWPTLPVAADEAMLRGAALHELLAVHWAEATGLLTPTRKKLVQWGRRLAAAELAATGVMGRPVIVPGLAPRRWPPIMRTLTCSWWARAAETRPPVRCWAPPASTALGTRKAR
jgi:nucleotide-binding universal stress UspA family protein